MKNNIIRKLLKIQRLIKDYVIRPYIDDASLNLTQIRIIIYLLNHQNDEVIQKDLEVETQLNKASITGSLDSLAQKGLISRIQAEDDKRKNIIVLTEKATSLKASLDENIEKINSKILNNVSEEDMNILYSTVDRIIENIKMEYNINEADI